MNITVDDQTRIAFRDALRREFREFTSEDGNFYSKRGDHYLIREFHKYCASLNIDIDEASLGRYLRDDNPVLPTPDRCRALAHVFGKAPIYFLELANYWKPSDMEVAGGINEMLTVGANHATPKAKVRMR